MANLLQINLNRTWRAQDLMTQTTVECEAALCLVSEPAGIPTSPRWLASENKLSAVYILGGEANMPGLVTLYRRGVRCVAVSFRRVIFISRYISPNASLVEYWAFLDEVTDIIVSAQNRDILLVGDFNAHSFHWGSNNTSRKGELLGNWAAGLDLHLVNIGNVPTCVRRQGSSVVDLTWASAGLLGRIGNWKVRES